MVQPVTPGAQASRSANRSANFWCIAAPSTLFEWGGFLILSIAGFCLVLDLVRCCFKFLPARLVPAYV